MTKTTYAIVGALAILSQSAVAGQSSPELNLITNQVEVEYTSALTRLGIVEVDEGTVSAKYAVQVNNIGWDTIATFTASNAQTSSNDFTFATATLGKQFITGEYGIFVEVGADLSFDVGSETKGVVQLTLNNGPLDTYVIPYVKGVYDFDTTNVYGAVGFDHQGLLGNSGVFYNINFEGGFGDETYVSSTLTLGIEVAPSLNVNAFAGYLNNEESTSIFGARIGYTF